MVLAKRHNVSLLLFHNNMLVGDIHEKWCSGYSMDLKVGLWYLSIEFSYREAYTW